jgi:hypothetical protein
MNEQQLPNDLGAEESVLANLLRFPDERLKILRSLNASDFYSAKHRSIFAAAKELGGEVDAGAIFGALEKKGNVAATGGIGWASVISDLLEYVPGAVALDDDIRKIIDAAARREFILGLRQIEEKAYSGDLPVTDALDALSRIERRQPELAPPISSEEFLAAKLAPACIVRDYIYADVGNLTAPGGTGKTTLLLFEMACIALGRELYGLEIEKPGRCLYVSAEDSREVLIARLREIAVGMALDDSECQSLMGKVLIWDVAGEGQKLIRLRDGNVELTSLADKIVSAYRSDPPVMVVFDPAISFGASEGLINENEQGLVTAARRIVRRLDCCVRYISHTGKASARGKSLDQYTARGGSALADGTRMTAVMQSWSPKDDRKLPPGLAHTNGSSITYLARPKLSYAPPNLPLIWIKRTGWAFEHVIETPVSDEEREKALLDQVERFIASEVKAGHFHSKKSLGEAMAQLDLSRAAVRSAVERLIAYGRVVIAALPKGVGRGNWKTYLTTFKLADFEKMPGELVGKTEEITS